MISSSSKSFSSTTFVRMRRLNCLQIFEHFNLDFQLAHEPIQLVLQEQERILSSDLGGGSLIIANHHTSNFEKCVTLSHSSGIFTFSKLVLSDKLVVNVGGQNFELVVVWGDQTCFFSILRK